MTFVDPVRDFGADLVAIEKPARYLGGELGTFSPISPCDKRLRIALCFPDLYEIGMSNNAIRILYEGLGRMRDQIVVERVFAPARDFEAFLKARSVPLYSLESGIPLCSCDILAISIGYELLATNILTVLNSGRIPLFAEERKEGDTIVIAGGPAVSNPLPFAPFLDAVYIGEAEAGFYELVAELALMKARGESRRELLARIGECSAIFTSAPRTTKRTVRAVFADFSTHVQPTAFPVPVLKTVQDHGTVEIMRGCPNGCRFCHAGYYYRPQRAKTLAAIHEEIDILVRKGGYREITLASLSSGDYPGIAAMVSSLNQRWAAQGISFQLPSLKVDSFSLPLLESLSEVRKSGLTFAVETPIETWQGSINKIVAYEKTAAILKEAKARGFRQAKFYFMIGLPVPEIPGENSLSRGAGEALAIVSFIERIAKVERIALHVNVGTFVPKPHTPYQREAQLGDAEAMQAIQILRDGLRPYHFIKLSYHSPFVSMLEGIISRGDERVGALIFDAWRRGARMDAWDEHIDWDIWKTVLRDADWDPEREILACRAPSAPLPWDSIDIRVGSGYLRHEQERSAASQLTPICDEPCLHPCGACTEDCGLVRSPAVPSDANAAAVATNVAVDTAVADTADADAAAELSGAAASINKQLLEQKRFILKFSKTGKAAFYPMHAVSGAFARAMLMLGIPVKFSEGFNPLPKMELTPPLTLGAASCGELCALWLSSQKTAQEAMPATPSFAIADNDVSTVIAAINEKLPAGLHVDQIRYGKTRAEGKRSIGALYYGSSYEIRLSDVLVRARLIQRLAELGIEVHQESAAQQESETALRFFLDDAKGGERSIVRILETCTDIRPVLTQCQLMRIDCFGKDMLPLFAML